MSSLKFGQITDRQTDRQTERQTDRQTDSDAQEPTVHKHRCAQKWGILTMKQDCGDRKQLWSCYLKCKTLTFWSYAVWALLLETLRYIPYTYPFRNYEYKNNIL